DGCYGADASSRWQCEDGLAYSACRGVLSEWHCRAAVRSAFSAGAGIRSSAARSGRARPGGAEECCGIHARIDFPTGASGGAELRRTASNDALRRATGTGGWDGAAFLSAARAGQAAAVSGAAVYLADDF